MSSIAILPLLWQYTRRARIAQSSALPTAVDEPASPFGDDSQGKACPTVSGLEAEYDMANIIKTSTLPHDSPPMVTSLTANEGSMQHKLNELTDLVKLLEAKDGGGAEPSREDATIKGRSLETGEEAAVEKSTKRGSNDTEELVNVLTSLDAASILTSEVQMVSVPLTAEVSTVSVPTGSGMVPTVSLIFTTASVVTPCSRQNGKEKMVELDTPKKKKLQEQIDVHVAREMEEQIAKEDQRMNEQIARDAEITKIHAEEELQMLIDGLDKNNETVAKYLHEYEQFAEDFSIGERIELINDLIEDFVPKGSKEEGERFKRKGLRLEQDNAKKLVPVEEVYVEALQVKHPIIDWEIHTKGQRNYWKIIRQAISDKEKELWVELKRLYKPDVEDQMWTQTQALMHDPVEWRLYDSCGVHHVLSRDQEIFMLVERDYPLRKGLAIVMISNKL
uniref:Uncharacterized protein n=1 Tax=Tanacetum cinerariifolium TaxID=118510 RepID=A0A6L2M7W2_TANCI|nr:hypothetical protein [Tanacetum cinerariifolium]